MADAKCILPMICLQTNANNTANRDCTRRTRKSRLEVVESHLEWNPFVVIFTV